MQSQKVDRKMFSENAKAFCIENLLGLDLRNCKQNTNSCDGVGEICPVPGQGTQCVHNSTQIVHGKYIVCQ